MLTLLIPFVFAVRIALVQADILDLQPGLTLETIDLALVEDTVRFSNLDDRVCHFPPTHQEIHACFARIELVTCCHLQDVELSEDIGDSIHGRPTAIP